MPAHQRLSGELRRRIEAGDFANGQRLPTEAELERQHGVSRQTVRRAFQDLVAEGLVRRIPGRGTFATHALGSARYSRSVGSIHDLMEWDDSDMDVVEEVSLKSDPEMASRLELPSPAVAVILLRRTFEGQPFAVSHVYLSPKMGQRLVEENALRDGARTVIRAVDSYLPDTVAGVQQVITAIAAHEEIAGLLELDPGAPVLRVERMYFDTEEGPVEIAITHYHPDRYAYRLELRGQVGTDPQPEQMAVQEA